MALTLCIMAALVASPAGQTRWKHGPKFGPGYFPIAVWLQNPANAERFQRAGINLYIGLWQGPTEEQLAALTRARMPVICEQNAVGLAHRDDPIIVGWMHQDEPDNAQPVTDASGQQSWGPCVPPEKIVAEYGRLRANDSTRPILLNVGQGVINDTWVGRGSGAKLSDYETYVKGGDIVSFDVYPIAGLDKPKPIDYMWYVGAGVERLRGWAGDSRTVWNCLECTRISNGVRKATPEQVRSQAWMGIIHGSRGLIYFVHEFKPAFNESALLDDPPMLRAVTELNAEITRLAPVINSPDLNVNIRVPGAQPSERPAVAAVGKQVGDATYLFAVGMRNADTRAVLTLPQLANRAVVEVIGENRTLPIRNGSIEDTFAPYAVHLYRVQR